MKATRGHAVNWTDIDTFLSLLLSITSTLKHAIATATDWRDPEAKPRHEWLYDYPAQCAITTTQIFWTEETESALDEYEGGQEDAVKKYLVQTMQQITVQMIQK